ncbi:hypothetical protein EJ08DRAFT_690407 [Tothia fuscella]|uniref:FYVE-type domain-containing protein n=1 Tax=Tothia fuscella TaxID=1048955 RepID=A0A9P4TSJ2_9PEZI|nr:hypothetical protein EJ08DRAFT_690407 [Tothia fuscella]
MQIWGLFANSDRGKVTLLQLNRHIDDLHANLEEVQQEEVKDWFKVQMTKAKKFQPLAVLNQKFKGLDIFESNDATSTPPSTSPLPAIGFPPPNHRKAASLSTTPEPPKPINPDEVVTRSHWQRQTYNDSCADPMCGKRLGGTNGRVNCRCCGKLFCEEHTMYQMKLAAKTAQHDPVRGIWCRVCETCYKSRDGYIDHRGFERNHTDHFIAIRRKTVDKQYLEVSRLEKRLSKLTQLLANPPPDDPGGGGSILWPLNSAKTQQRNLEQSVIMWEDDASVPKCPFCQQEFSTYTFRRHHCRMCGRVVCSDPRTDCSADVPLDVATPTNLYSEKSTSDIKSLNVRICKDCRHTLFSKKDFANEIEHKPPDARSYENLVQFERGIRLMLPRFQKLLQALQDPDTPPTHEQVTQATKIRKRLTDAFIQYEAAARRIRDFPTESPTQARLQKAVHAQATSFLHLHMLPLKSLPKILKHASPHGNSISPRPSAHSTPNGSSSKLPTNGALASIKFNNITSGAGAGAGDSSSQISSRSSAIESLEAEEKELRERLIVLEEQKFIVGEMLNDARKRRKFDEVASLSANVDDLTREIDDVGGQLAGLDFAGVYGGGGMGLPGTPPVVGKG